jgi:hypothetical protein
MDSHLPHLPSVATPQNVETSQCSSNGNSSRASSRSSGASTSEISRKPQRAPRQRYEYNHDVPTAPNLSWPNILVRIISESMRISVRSAAALAGPQRNVLTHILVHGVSGCYKSVLRFLSELNAASRDISAALYQHSLRPPRGDREQSECHQTKYHDSKRNPSTRRKSRRRRDDQELNISGE